ncbi:hypothetical protein AALO_G00183320 [Alosa alosa]|uniref:Tumor necrosis factor receptor superfamily member 1A n=1 Tax=Alosa alosa TaxID=278164 RepID=A0AAV6G9K5_9TELE|nr:tumor necrosis factor receptor superfamily member 1A [Alosa alosa]KAG5271723.1 hypothetical protein AALO_G00183320 [Alosa alosa]
MGRGRHMSTWTNNVGLCSLIFVLLVLQSHAVRGVDSAGPWPSQSPASPTNSSHEVKCQLDEYLHSSKQFCCNKCNPGFKLDKECDGPGKATRCQQCIDGYSYIHTANSSPNCFKCNRCKDNEVEITKCDYKTNRICECKEGYYKKSITKLDHQCVRCTTCGDGEREIKACKPEQNRVCDCKYLHPRENSSTTCTFQCSKISDLCHQCGQREKCPGPGNQDWSLIVAVPFTIMATALLTALGMLSYKAIKHRLMREKLQGKSPATSEPPGSPCESLDSTESLLIVTTPESHIRNDHNEGVPFSIQVPNETQTALPDCVPQEINTSKFIYSILEEVPVARVTELVRLLGVKDQDIERARRDNPLSCKDAHYDMLKRWADSGTRRRTTTLPWPLLLQLLATLRDMGLGGCAESLEVEYDLDLA